MSSSDSVAARAPAEPHDPAAGSGDEVLMAIATLERAASAGALSSDHVRAAVSAVTRLYVEASARAGRELPPADEALSTTDALTLACALVRSQDLTPFEMAVWFARGQRTE